jgi:succinate dehydrogenase/fumarate reductase flavoprotein subunit
LNIKWDIEKDIVVVGSGAAGSAAAATAFSQKASVVMLEKSPAIGGTSMKSGGQPWIPNNFALRASGIKDLEADCLRFMARGNYPQLYNPEDTRFGLPQHEYDLLEAYYRNASKAIEHFMKIGACQFIQSQPILPDYLDHVPENKVLRGRLVAPSNKEGKTGFGTDLMRQFSTWINAQQIPVMPGYRVDEIIQDEQKQVIGVYAKNGSGNRIAVRARKAVIFGSGGYTHNPELILQFQKGPSFGGCAVITNTGDFIYMAEALGAQLSNMNGAWNAEIPLEEALGFPSTSDDVWQPTGDSMMLVNKYGVRVVNEKRSYNDRTKSHFYWDPNEGDYPNQILCMIFDQRTLDLYGGSAEPYPLPAPGTTSPYVISGQTWAELVKNIDDRIQSIRTRIGEWRLSADFALNLNKTVERFNGFANRGKDDDFHRGDFPYDVEWHKAVFSVPVQGTKWQINNKPNITMYPFNEQGPYYCILLAAGTLDTNGGPKINKIAQVLDSKDIPIPGLYGAGNCIAAPMPYYIAGGATLGNALTFGYIAGMNAVNEPVK